MARLEENMVEKRVLFEHMYKIEVPSIKEVADELFELGKKIAPFMGDSFNVIDKAIAQNKKILYEGAQGVLLDIDYFRRWNPNGSRPSWKNDGRSLRYHQGLHNSCR